MVCEPLHGWQAVRNAGEWHWAHTKASKASTFTRPAALHGWQAERTLVSGTGPTPKRRPLNPFQALYAAGNPNSLLELFEEDLRLLQCVPSLMRFGLLWIACNKAMAKATTWGHTWATTTQAGHVFDVRKGMRASKHRVNVWHSRRIYDHIIDGMVPRL